MVDNVNGLNALPIGATGNNIPAHIQLLKDDLNGGSIIRRLTGAQIAALTGAQKAAGVLVYNTTTDRLQVSNGSAWVDVGAPVYAVGTRDSALTLAAYTDTTITYTAETDPSAMLNTGTGVVTLPSAGLWLLTGFVAGTTTGYSNRLAIVHGSTEVARQAMTDSANVSALVVAAASDTVYMAAYNDSTAKSAIVARFTVAKIGA